jgi:hypothetical protein
LMSLNPLGFRFWVAVRLPGRKDERGDEERDTLRRTLRAGKPERSERPGEHVGPALN